MVRKETEKIIAALDIGTSKILIVVARFLDDRYEVLAVERCESRGVEGGILSDLSQAVRVVIELLDKLDRSYDLRLNLVVTGISGQHVEGMRRQVSTAIDSEMIGSASVVQLEHLEALKASVYKATTTSQRKILHTFFHNFLIDGNMHVQNPIGMVARKLTTDCFMVTCSSSAYITILDMLKRLKLTSAGVVLQQVASAQAVLTHDERRMGICLIDIGAGTCDVCVYVEGTLALVEVIPYAGNHISRDIAKIMHVPLSQAEKIKKMYGLSERTGFERKETVKIEDEYYQAEYRELLLSDLAMVIGSRVEETFVMIRDKIMEAGLLSDLHGGIVLTGGGSNLTSIDQTVRKIFHPAPVRIKGPSYEGANRELVKGQEFSTALGCLEYYCSSTDQSSVDQLTQTRANLLGKMSNRLRKKYHSIQQWFG